MEDPNKESKLKNKFYSEVRRNDLLNRLNNNSKDSHHFIESNKLIA